MEKIIEKISHDEIKRRLLAIKMIQPKLSIAEMSVLTNGLGKRERTILNYLNGSGGDYELSIDIINAGEKIIRERQTK